MDCATARGRLADRAGFRSPDEKGRSSERPFMVSVNRTLAGLLCVVLVGLGAMIVIKLGEWLFAKLNA